MIDIVDELDKLAQFVPVLNDMIKQGLVISESINVLINRHGQEEQGDPSPPITTQKSPGVSINDIHIYTDGSAIGNPGPGGYGIILILDGEDTESSQGFEYITNNRMEILAVIMALEQSLA